ncbi:MAG: FimB/Mfa2 family fimbrial subunit [Phocaeicola sp.]
MKPSIKKRYIQLLMLALSYLTTACHSVLGSDLEPCAVEYQIKFKYDRNLKYADAFAHEVHSIALYAFNEEGSLVHKLKEEGEALNREDYSMSVNFNPLDYHLVVWGGIKEKGEFSLPNGGSKEIEKKDLSCWLKRDHETGIATVQSDLSSLFHGLIPKGSILYETTKVTIPLTKNTNHIRVVLQQMSGESMDASNFSFSINDSNGLLSYANEVLPDEEITYLPWRIDSGTTEVSRSKLNVIVAEFTMGRLVSYNKPILKVLNNKGQTILSIPLIAYALLVKGHYNQSMSDQEYLDRQDEYNLTFFLDQDLDWINTSVVINGWKIVLNESDL